MPLKIIIYPNPILKQKAEKVEKITPEIQELVLAMKQTLATGEEGRTKGVGLAANQIGVLKRIIVILTKEGIKAFVNPKILKLSRQKTIDKEGCLSLPEVWLEIKRPLSAEIEAVDENGQPIHIAVQGFPARIFQHEIDHLDGILFFERLGFFERLKTKVEINKIFKRIEKS